jgi:23S rRNA (cytidine1920-2'-O)/16S rRNA (cytidine1409-2'-O)-methyltransferase
VEQRIRETCAGLGLKVLDYFASNLMGGDGNREFFVLAEPDASPQKDPA